MTTAERAFPPAATGQEVPEHSAAELLENFFDTNSRQINRDKPWSRDDVISAVGGGYTVKFLIATLPEPGLASLRSQFDTDLDALSEALNDARYTLASFDLPWLDEAKSDSHEFALDQPIDLSAPGAEKPSLEIAPAEHRRSEYDPGLMLFDSEVGDEFDSKVRDQDNKKASKQLLVLFLVGESPTRGVNKTALRDALDQIVWISGRLSEKKVTAPLDLGSERPVRQLRGQSSRIVLDKKTLSSSPLFSKAPVFPVHAQLCAKPHLIKIIGPTFSGSATSLRNTLEEWSGSAPQWSVSIVSGAATAVTSADVKINRPSVVDYKSVRIPGEVMVDYIRKSFHSDGSEPPVVLLHENTVYGAHFRHDFAPHHNFISLTFPLHISDLRTAAGNDMAAAPSLMAALGEHDLPLPDEAGQQGEDVVPSFSNRSKVYDELVLENLLRTIHAARARYVGIVATDAEDLIFLAQQVRANCPDIVLFTTSSDLLYTHSEFASDLDGLLVFSTYPLFNPSQIWGEPDKIMTDRNQLLGYQHRSLRQFPREDAEGFYNAALVQLGRPDLMRDFVPPFLSSVDSGAVSSRVNSQPLYEASTPQLWLSVVGRESLWPVKFYPSPQDIEEMPIFYRAIQKSPPHNLEDLYPLSLQTATLMLTVLCLIPCAVFLVGLDRHAAVVKWPLKELLVGDSVCADLNPERRFRIAALIGTLLITYLIGFCFYLLPERAIYQLTNSQGFLNSSGESGLQLSVWIVAIVGVIIALPLILVAALCAFRKAIVKISLHADPAFDSAFSGERNFPVKPTGALLAFVGTCVGILLVSIFVGRIWVQEPAEALFTFMRSANLGNRVSPLMPLIFLGIANLSLIGGDLWRLRTLEACRVPLPFLGFDNVESFRGVAELERRVIKALECSWCRLPGSWLLVLMLAGLVFIFLANGGPVYPMDGSAFYLLFFASTGFVYLYFSTLLLRFVAVWRALHRLLRRLYWHPSRAAYEELRVSILPDHSEQQWIRLSESQPTLSAIEYCLERAREILSLSRKHLPSYYIAPRITEAQVHFTSALVAHAHDKRRDMLFQRFQANRKTADLSSEIVKLVEPMWRLGNQQAPNADEHILRQARLFIASRVVEFLRQVFPQLINLAAFAMTGVLAMMLAFSVYPFSDHDTIIWLSWISLLAVVGISLTVFILINRNRVVSMLMGTAPGRFNWDSTFSLQLLIYGVLPILALLGAQFPHVFGGFLSWSTGLFGGAKQ